MNKRDEIQKNTLENFTKVLNNKNSLLFAEIPTGTGKTKITLDTAKEALSKGKSIIVSTSNNYLVLEYLQEAEKFNINKEKIHIAIGKDNYINKKIVLDDEFLSEFNLRKEDVEEWLEKNKNYPLNTFFVEYFSLPKEAEDILYTQDSFLDEEDNRSIKKIANEIVENPGIYVTNHYYLLALLKYANNENFYNLNIIVDEVHLLNNTARMLYKVSFSPYRLWYFTKKIAFESKVSKKNKNKLSRFVDIVDSFLEVSRSYSNSNKADYSNLFSILESLFENEITKEAIEILNTLKKKDIIAKKAIQELYEAKSVLAKRTHATVSFSPIKKYPKFEIFMENPVSILRNILTNHHGNFIGISGTLRVTIDSSLSSNRWSFQRVGFYSYKNIKNDNEAFFNMKILNAKFSVYPRIFSKKQAMYYIATDEKFKPVNYKNNQESAIELYRQWVKNLSELAEETICGNTLILMSSFENIELIRDFLLENDKIKQKYEIYISTFGSNMRKVVAEYKKSIDEGKKAILIGGLNFYTGLDLHGKYLQTLFIGKLPIEPKGSYFTTFKVGEFSIQEDMRKNALLTFRQGIGRAIRSEKDKAFIVIGDPRINNKRYNVFRDFLEEYGVEVKG